MADFVFNIAKGKVARYAELPETSDALILVLLKSSGIEADGTLRDHDNLSVLLASTNDECDFTGYSRKTLSGVTVTVDDGADSISADAADPTSYTNSGAAQTAAKAVICYDNDTGSGTDTSLVPLVALDCAVTFDTGVATTLQFNASGFFGAT